MPIHIPSKVKLYANWVVAVGNLVTLVLALFRDPSFWWLTILLTAILVAIWWRVIWQVLGKLRYLRIHFVSQLNQAESIDNATRAISTQWYYRYGEKAFRSGLILLERIRDKLREDGKISAFPVIDNAVVELIHNPGVRIDDKVRRLIDAGNFGSDDIDEWYRIYRHIVSYAARLSCEIEGGIKSWNEYSTFEDHHNKMLNALDRTVEISAFDNFRNDAESLSLRNYNYC
jgi:hypothetical protein